MIHGLCYEDRFDAAFGNTPANFNFHNEIDERDLLIERLTKEIHQLRAELESVKAEDQRQIALLREEIAKLEKILSELRVSAEASLSETTALKRELERARVHTGAAVKLTESEKLSKANEEKFKKMKDVYQKLRDEHVTLLRQHADATKQLTAEKKILEEKEQIIKDNAADMARLEDERLVIQSSLQKSANEVTQQLGVTTAANTDLEKRKQELESQLKLLRSAKDDLDQDLNQSKALTCSLESQLTEVNSDKAGMEERLTGQLANLQSEFDSLKADKEGMQTDLQQQLGQLKGTLSKKETSFSDTETELRKHIDELKAQVEKISSDKRSSETRLTSELDELHKRLLSGSIAEGRAFIEDALAQFENHTFTTVRCTAEFLLSRGDPVLQCLTTLTGAHGDYSTDRKAVEKLVECITGFSHHLGDCVIHGLATSQSTAQIEPGQALSNLCRAAGEHGLAVLDAIETGGGVTGEVASVRESVEGMMRLAAELVPRTDDVKVKEIADMVDSEMVMTSKAIELAAAKIQEMLQNARQSSTGVELEVNERILDACTDLMKAIKVLVEKSRDLQQEIVAQGRGTSTAKDFYKKNHRWTEGFISAAKAVGWGATTLMEAADKVVKGEGKLEELIVCSQEIAASTAQLVVSSRVKSKRNSPTMSKLQEASKHVSTATGNVVACVKTGAQIIEDKSLMDFSHLSLHQTKKQEMDSQVRVLELQRELELERRNLGQLRKQHYQLAGEEEGLEQEMDDDDT